MPPNSAPTSLGIDIGTTNVKVALVEWRLDQPSDDGNTKVGHTLTTASCPTPTTLPELLTAVAELALKCLADHPAPLAVGFSSMAESGFLINHNGEALGPLIGWADQRAVDVMPELTSLVDPAVLFGRTGVRLTPKPPLAKWFWFTRHEPLLWARARWAGVIDVVVHALTGRYATDHTLAGRTGAFPLDTNGWDPDLLALGGLTLARTSEVLAPRELAGIAQRDALGGAIPAGTPIFVAGHDHAVGSYAVNVRSPGQVADSLGTSEAVYAVVGETSPEQREHWHANGMSIVRTVADNAHAVIAGSPAAGALVAWWAKTQRGGVTPDELFTELAADLPANTFVLPYLRGRQAPWPDPGARLTVFGLADYGYADGTMDIAPGQLLSEQTTSSLTPAETVAAENEALLRGLVLHARWMTEVAYGGQPHESIVLGGPTRNKAWMTRKSELTPWPTRLATSPDAVVIGAALVAAENVGLTVAPLTTTPLTAPLDPHHKQMLDAFIAAARG